MQQTTIYEPISLKPDEIRYLRYLRGKQKRRAHWEKGAPSLSIADDLLW
jgi:hypothetical protein